MSWGVSVVLVDDAQHWPARVINGRCQWLSQRIPCDEESAFHVELVAFKIEIRPSAMAISQVPEGGFPLQRVFLVHNVFLSGGLRSTKT